MVMQSAEHRHGQNGPKVLNSSGNWCILADGQVRSCRVVILGIRAEHVTQMPLAKYDQMVKTLASDRSERSAPEGVGKTHLADQSPEPKCGPFHTRSQRS